MSNGPHLGDPWQGVEKRISQLSMSLRHNADNYKGDIASILSQSLKELCVFLNRKFPSLKLDLAASEYVSSTSVLFKGHFQEVKEAMARNRGPDDGGSSQDIVRALCAVDSKLEGFHAGLSKIHPPYSSFPFLRYLDRNSGSSMYLIYANGNSDINDLKAEYPRAIVVSLPNRQRLVRSLTSGLTPLTNQQIKKIKLDDREYLSSKIKGTLRKEIAGYSCEQVIYDCSRATVALSHPSFLEGPWKNSLRATLNIPVFLGIRHLGDVVFTSGTVFHEESRTLAENFAYRLLALLHLTEQSLLDRFIHFASFMPLTRARELLSSSVDVMLSNVKPEQATVLMVDIRGFSQKVNTYFEECADKTLFPRMLNEFRRAMILSVWEEEGIVDKFIGDAVMAIFLGSSNEAAKKAVASAVKMVGALRAFNYTFKKEWKKHSAKNDWEPWDIGIGITTGEALLGIFGIDYRYEFTAVGKLVNKVSRIKVIPAS